MSVMDPLVALNLSQSLLLTFHVYSSTRNLSSLNCNLIVYSDEAFHTTLPFAIDLQPNHEDSAYIGEALWRVQGKRDQGIEFRFQDCVSVNDPSASFVTFPASLRHQLTSSLITQIRIIALEDQPPIRHSVPTEDPSFWILVINLSVLIVMIISWLRTVIRWLLDFHDHGRRSLVWRSFTPSRIKPRVSPRRNGEEGHQTIELMSSSHPQPNEALDAFRAPSPLPQEIYPPFHLLPSYRELVISDRITSQVWRQHWRVVPFKCVLSVFKEAHCLQFKRLSMPVVESSFFHTLESGSPPHSLHSAGIFRSPDALNQSLQGQPDLKPMLNIYQRITWSIHGLKEFTLGSKPALESGLQHGCRSEDDASSASCRTWHLERRVLPFIRQESAVFSPVHRKSRPVIILQRVGRPNMGYRRSCDLRKDSQPLWYLEWKVVPFVSRETAYIGCRHHPPPSGFSSTTTLHVTMRPLIVCSGIDGHIWHLEWKVVRYVSRELIWIPSWHKVQGILSKEPVVTDTMKSKSFIMSIEWRRSCDHTVEGKLLVQCIPSPALIEGTTSTRYYKKRSGSGRNYDSRKRFCRSWDLEWIVVPYVSKQSACHVILSHSQTSRYFLTTPLAHPRKIAVVAYDGCEKNFWNSEWRVVPYVSRELICSPDKELDILSKIPEAMDYVKQITMHNSIEQVPVYDYVLKRNLVPNIPRCSTIQGAAECWWHVEWMVVPFVPQKKVHNGCRHHPRIFLYVVATPLIRPRNISALAYIGIDAQVWNSEWKVVPYVSHGLICITDGHKMQDILSNISATLDYVKSRAVRSMMERFPACDFILEIKSASYIPSPTIIQGAVKDVCRLPSIKFSAEHSNELSDLNACCSQQINHAGCITPGLHDSFVDVARESGTMRPTGWSSLASSFLLERYGLSR